MWYNISHEVIVVLDLLEWLQNNQLGEMVFTTLVSMVPVVELRGGLPFGVALGLPYWAAYLSAVVGNILPAPFIVVYIRRIFQWMRRRLPRLDHLVDRLEAKAHLKGRKVTKYKYLGLMLLVAVPLPGTGAWSGSLIAALLDVKMRYALPAVIAGVFAAGVIMTVASYGLLGAIQLF